MREDTIVLTPKDILEKQFKLDTRGYRPQEVDKFLDIIIRDYEAYNRNLKILENEKKDLFNDNIKLKQDIKDLKAKLDLIKTSSSEGVSNADVLRRLSNLEKVIYGKE